MGWFSDAIHTVTGTRKKGGGNVFDNIAEGAKSTFGDATSTQGIMAGVTGGMSELMGLIPKPNHVNPLAAPPLPSRDQVIQNVLNQQLEMLKKRNQNGVLGGTGVGQNTSPLASTTLFGA